MLIPMWAVYLVVIINVFGIIWVYLIFWTMSKTFDYLMTHTLNR